MKTSWPIGVIMLYIWIFAVEMMMTGGTAFSATSSERLDVLMAPTIANQSGPVSAIVSIAANAGNYFMTFVNALFLWSPTVFEGYAVWIWLFICLPVSVGMVIAIVTLLRGGSSS